MGFLGSSEIGFSVSMTQLLQDLLGTNIRQRAEEMLNVYAQEINRFPSVTEAYNLLAVKLGQSGIHFTDMISLDEWLSRLGYASTTASQGSLAEIAGGTTEFGTALGQSVTIQPVEIYEVILKTNINPQLPNWIVERLRDVLHLSGYGLNNIYVVENGYKMDIEKFGSFPLLAVWGGVKIVLFLIGIVIALIEVRKITENTSSTYQVGNNIDDALAFADENNYTPEQTNDLIKSIQGAYEGAGAGDSDGGILGGGLNTSIALGLLGLLIVLGMKK